VIARALLLALPFLGAPVPAEDPFAAAAKGVQKAAGERDPAPMADALYALRECDGEPAARLLLSVVGRKETPDFVIDAGMDAVAGWSGAESASVLAKDLEKSRDARRFLLLEALGRHGHAAAEEALVAAAADRDPRFRTAALRALADRKAPSAAARAAVNAAVLDADPRVRSAAIAALSGWKGIPGALPLLGRLGTEKGRLFGDAWRGLQRISGRNLPPAPDLWAEWWRTLPDEDQWRYDSVPAPPKASVAGPGVYSFSRRVVFVLDISEGMADKPGYRGEDLAPEDQRADPAVFAEWKAMKSRLDHARAHLLRMIRQLPADASFDVVFGAETAGAVFRSPQPATPENRDRAEGRVRGLNAKERQDVLRLLTAAWASSPEGDPLSPESFAEGADTVVYLGTALPSWGAERDAGRIASTVRRWNRVRQVQFFGIGVGAHGTGLLADLASMTPVGGSSGID
jgi:hypothetical protein